MPKGKGPKSNVNYITLEDGTQIPYAIPSHIPPEVGQQVIAHLQSNPEAAKQALAAAQQISANPELANMYLNMRRQSANPPTPGQEKMFQILRDDPELRPIFEEVQRYGPGVMQKYLEDEELMAKISKKLREQGLNGKGEEVPVTSEEEEAAEASAAEGESTTDATPSKQKGKKEAANIFDAASQGDLAAIDKFVAAGADIDAKNEKGIPVLGLAVGFNQPAAVEKLLEKGADVNVKDVKDNTCLHYAAGYGRRNCAEVLIKAGAEITAKNKDGQTPIDVAKQNGERAMVQFLQQRSRMAKKLAENKSAADGSDAAAADKADPLAGIDITKLTLEEVDALLNSLSTKSA